MYRFADFRKSQGEHDYIVGSAAPEPRYGDFSEFLGCLWSP
jgi:hypothetical protein